MINNKQTIAKCVAYLMPSKSLLNSCKLSGRYTTRARAFAPKPGDATSWVLRPVVVTAVAALRDALDLVAFSTPPGRAAVVLPTPAADDTDRGRSARGTCSGNRLAMICSGVSCSVRRWSPVGAVCRWPPAVADVAECSMQSRLKCTFFSSACADVLRDSDGLMLCDSIDVVVVEDESSDSGWLWWCTAGDLTGVVQVLWVLPALLALRMRSATEMLQSQPAVGVTAMLSGRWPYSRRRNGDGSVSWLAALVAVAPTEERRRRGVRWPLGVPLPLPGWLELVCWPSADSEL